MLCTAKSKRTGEQCRHHATPGRNVCRHHGGKSLVGIASPSFKTGRYSKYIPARLNERYQEAVSDSELLALREDIALIDARLVDLLQRVDTGESGRLWRLLQQTHAEMLQARAASDTGKMAMKLTELGHLIQEGLADYAAWDDVSKTLEQRRKLVESERKRLVEMQQMITTERAMVLLSVVVDTIRRHVRDRDTLAAISADIGRIVVDSASRSLSAG